MARLHRGTQGTISSSNTMTTPPTTTLMILQWRKIVPFVVCRTRNSVSFLHRAEREGLVQSSDGSDGSDGSGVVSGVGIGRKF